jgi:hypothetical protein
MLDKIRNLSLNINSSGSAAYYSIYEKGNQRERKSRDNYVKSEALKYLNELEWIIRAINFLSESKLDIGFVASDVEFRTVIDLNERIINEIQYSVSQAFDNAGDIKKLTAALSINTNSELKIVSNRQKELEAIKNLFIRLFRYDIPGEITSDDSNILDDLLEGSNFEIYSDLVFVSQCLLVFVHKLTGIKITTPQYLSEPSVKLLNIKASSAY